MNLKEKMKKKKGIIGTFLELGSTSMVECLALSGFDYMIIDTEHGPFETESVAEYICAGKMRNMLSLVRVKELSRAAVLKNLDAGANGVIIPNIQSVEEVEKAVEYGKYFPLGKRGVAFSRGCGYGMEEELTMRQYFDKCNQDTMIIPQCETVGCLENIETIVQMDGVDGIFIGPYDLSTAMGKPGQFDDGEIISAIKRIKNACDQSGKMCIIYVDSTMMAKKRMEAGFEAITLSMDAILIIQQMKKLIEEIKS